jgi:molybdate/tungstate transport system substrate-binding protein
VIGCAAIVAAGCSSSSSSSGGAGAKGGSGGHSTAPKATGTANVAYAASLAFLNEKIFGPAFAKATGNKYEGTAGPSDGLSSEIAAKSISPNVFISVGAGPITDLEPKFTSWSVQYAATSIVLAYNPKSKYASDFKAFASGKKPLSGLFTLMTKPGFQLGRTDPNTDPQGRAFIDMLELAQMKYHLPKSIVTKIIGGPEGSAKSTQIFEEAALDSRLQAGQLDAASAYLSQAKQLHLPYITLPNDINLGDPTQATNYAKASVTITDDGQKVTKAGSPLAVDVTVIKGATDQAAADSFVSYILSSDGLALYSGPGGYTLLKPTLTSGSLSDLPASVRKELAG